MTSVITGLNAGIRPSLCHFRDWMLFTDGDNIARYLDQNQGYILMHVDPTTAITTDETQAGSMSGVFKYLYTEYNKNSSDGDFHSGHETNPSAVYTTGTLSSKKVVLTLPGTTLNSGFTHLKIYRTLASGAIYYYIGNVAIGTTSFTDNNITGDVNNPFGLLSTGDDGTVTSTYLNYRMPNSKFLMASKNRVFAFGVRPKTDGTVTTNGTTTITGSGTKWTKALEGDVFYCNNGSRGYIVSNVASAISLTLTEAYAGANASGQSYSIEGNDSKINWTAKHPVTAKPMWWAFPSLYYRILRSWDSSPLMGGNMINDMPVAFKQYSHYYGTESGNDYIFSESNTKVGTGSHWSIVGVPDLGSLIFLSMSGKLYETSGQQATDLNVNLTETVDGINLTPQYLEMAQGVWYDKKKIYAMIYCKKGSTSPDRVLIYYYDLKQYTILTFRANCIHEIEDTESGQTVYKPWIGTVGGFIYKTFTGDNFGASSGTLKGTSTAFGASTITDSGAAFYTTDDGLKDVYIRLYDADGTFKEEQKILSNTGTQITINTPWTSSPVAGWAYEVGGIHWKWKSKVFDSDTSMTVRDCKLLFEKESSETNVRVNLYESEDSEMDSTPTQFITFDLSQNYYLPTTFKDNRNKCFQYEIEGHGTAHPATINSIDLNLLELSA